jgi:hypothetical protein
MSAQIEARKNQMITELTSFKTECSLWERSKISLNEEYQRKLLETIRSTRENIARGTKTEPIKLPAREMEHRGTKYLVSDDNTVFYLSDVGGKTYNIMFETEHRGTKYLVSDDNMVFYLVSYGKTNNIMFYVGFWISSERAVFIEEDDTDDEDDDEDEEEEKEDKEENIKTPKQPANPLGLSLEFPIIPEDDEDTLCAKYEYELVQEMLLMKEKVIELEREYSRRIGVLDKRIHVLNTRIAELEAMLVKFGSKISNMKMKQIKELTEMANSVWMNR